MTRLDPGNDQNSLGNGSRFHGVQLPRQRFGATLPLMQKHMVFGVMTSWFAAAVFAAACGGDQAEPAAAESPARMGVVVPAAAPSKPQTVSGSDLVTGLPERPIAPPVAASVAEEPGPDPTTTDLQKARELFMQGVSAYSEGRYEDSRDALEAAYALVPKPQILYNLAMVEEKLGNTAAACKHLESYVRDGSPPTSRLQQVSAQLQKCGIQP